MAREIKYSGKWQDADKTIENLLLILANTLMVFWSTLFNVLPLYFAWHWVLASWLPWFAHTPFSLWEALLLSWLISASSVRPTLTVNER